MESLEVKLFNKVLKNPITNASGTFNENYKKFFDVNIMGAITTKGVSFDSWHGNTGTRIAETPSGMLNSIGLENPGVKELCKNHLDFKTNIIVNVVGHTMDEYVEVVKYIEKTKDVFAYEINISCPNVDKGGLVFGTDEVLSNKLISLIRANTKKPLIVKLSPNVTDITKIAKAVLDAGADALSLINTVLGLSINYKTKKCELARGVGGLSGPAIKPIALYMVSKIYNTFKDVPIIAMGGISSYTDVIEFMLAGADMVAIGTANFSEPFAIPTILNDLTEYVRKNKLKSISELKGGAFQC